MDLIILPEIRGACGQELYYRHTWADVSISARSQISLTSPLPRVPRLRFPQQRKCDITVARWEDQSSSFGSEKLQDLVEPAEPAFLVPMSMVPRVLCLQGKTMGKEVS